MWYLVFMFILGFGVGTQIDSWDDYSEDSKKGDNRNND